MALVRRPLYQPVQSQQSVYLNVSQVASKQVITCNKGRNLGTIGEAWVDPGRLEVVSFELESKRTVGSSVTGCIPLMMFKQVGDVVLVQDVESVPLQMDGRSGCVKLVGMEIKTRNGRVIGKVRDFAFNPNNGTITKIEFDDFGLTFLPVNFFDTTSIASDFIDSVAYGAVIISTDEYARPERPGILSNLLRGLGTRQVAGLLSDGSRASEAAALLPAGYTYEKWQSDIARWEMETGLRYEEYMAQQQQQAMYGGPRGALPPGRQPQQPLQPQQAGPGPLGAQGQGGRYALPSAAGRPAAARPGVGAPLQPQQQPGPGPQQQGQPAYGYQSAQQAPQYGASYGGGAGDPRLRGPAGPAPGRYAGAPAAPAAGAPPQQQQQWGQPQSAAQQPAYGGGQWGPQPPLQRQPAAAGAAARGPGPAGPGLPGPSQSQQQQPQPQAPMQAPQQQAGGYQGQYGWPGNGPAPGAVGVPGGGPEGGQQAPVQGGGGGGALRVDEWLAREGQGAAGEPALEAAGRPQQPAAAAAVQQQQQQGGAAEANGWDAQGAGGGRLPY